MENQEIIFRLGMMEQQMQELQQQIQAVERAINDLQLLSLGMENLIGSKDKEIFAQVGKGIYIRAKIISEELNVNVGDNNFVSKNIPETKNLINEQIKKLEDVREDLEKNIEAMNNEFLKTVEEYDSLGKGKDELQE